MPWKENCALMDTPANREPIQLYNSNKEPMASMTASPARPSALSKLRCNGISEDLFVAAR